MELLLRTIQSPLVLWDPDGDPVLFNDAFCRTFGYAPDEASALNRDAFVHPDERDQTRRLVASRLPGDLSQRRFRRRLIARDGRIVHADCTSTGFPIAGGVTAVLVEYRDITAHLSALEELEREENRFRRLFERSSIAVFTTDEQNHFETANPACLRLLDRTLEQLKEVTPLDLVHPSYRPAMLRRRVERGGRLDIDDAEPVRVPVRQGTDRYLWCEVQMLPRLNPDGTFIGTDGFARDISQELEGHRPMDTLAGVDELTGLADRRSLDQTIEVQIEEAARDGLALSLLVVELDRLEQINDRHGRLAGDAALRSGATALKEFAEPSEVISRYAGESFAVVLPGANLDDAVVAAERYRRIIEKATCAWEERPIRVTATVAVVSYNPAFHRSADDLYRDIEGALHVAKQRGHNTVCVANDLSPGHRAA